MMTQEELRTLGDWRFANRMPTGAAAVRELLKRSLADDGSQDFEITRATGTDKAYSAAD